MLWVGFGKAGPGNALKPPLFNNLDPQQIVRAPDGVPKQNRRPFGRLFCFMQVWGLEPERQHLSRRFAQREARNVRRHMSQELRSVATNDAIRISSARGQP